MDAGIQDSWRQGCRDVAATPVSRLYLSPQVQANSLLGEPSPMPHLLRTYILHNYFQNYEDIVSTSVLKIQEAEMDS